jgi:hypothetical protein
MLILLENNILATSNFSIIDFSDEIIKDINYHKNPISKFFLFNLIRFPFWGCSMAFRKELLNYILPFPPNIILHDNWIGFIALKKGTIGYIDDPLFLYRRHSYNVSFGKGKSSHSILYRVYYRIRFWEDFKKRIDGDI